MIFQGKTFEGIFFVMQRCGPNIIAFLIFALHGIYKVSYRGYIDKVLEYDRYYESKDDIMHQAYTNEVLQHIGAYLFAIAASNS